MKNCIEEEEIKLKRLYIDENSLLEPDEDLIMDFSNKSVMIDEIEMPNNHDKKSWLKKIINNVEEVLEKGFLFMVQCVRGF